MSKKLIAIALLMAGTAVAAPKKKAPPPAPATPVDPYADPAPVDPYAAPKKASVPPLKKDPPKPVDPYALPPPPKTDDKDAPTAIPSRVGLSDLTAVQGLLAVQNLDAWLLYD